MNSISSSILENNRLKLNSVALLSIFILIEVISFIIPYTNSETHESIVSLHRILHIPLDSILLLLLLKKNKIIRLLEQKNKKFNCISKQSITLLSIENKLKEFKKEFSNDLNKTNALTSLLEHFSSNQGDLKESLSYSYAMNEELVTNLKQAHPSLSRSEVRLCILIQQGFDSKEIAKILNISPNSVKTIRYRIRKKMKLNRKQNLYQLLSKFQLLNPNNTALDS